MIYWLLTVDVERRGEKRRERERERDRRFGFYLILIDL